MSKYYNYKICAVEAARIKAVVLKLKVKVECLD